jgi:hypothetical protein
MLRLPGTAWFRVFLVFLLAAPCASAQIVRVRALEDSSRAPIGGAIVRLLRGDSTLAQGLTNPVGRVTLRAPAPGRYLLRVSRIGYAVSAPIPIDVAAGETRGIDLALPAVRVSLPTIVVRGQKQCGGLPDDRATAAVLWEQIRQALTRTQLSERSSRLFTRSTALRELTRGGAVREEQRSPEQTGTGKPFVTVSPAELANLGFVRTTGDSITFNAPDADLLLADQFVATHCFTVSAPPDSLPGHVGLRFEPASGRRIADIRGVLWVERQSVELRLLEFQYTTSPLHGVGAIPGGRLAFGRLTGGEFYVRDWSIRMPRIGRSRSTVLGVAGAERDSLLGFVEKRGRAVPAAEPRGIVAPAILTGMVYDSLAGHGLAGVVVTVAGVPDRAVTDSLGTFALSVPVSGARVVTLAHALLELLPERATRTVELAPEASAHIVTSTPGPAAVAQRMCRGETGAAGLVGLVARAPERPLADIAVEATWFSVQGSAGVRRQTEATRSDERGLWAFCDLPGGVPVTVRQLDGQRQVALVNETVDPRRFRWLDLGDSLARASAGAPAAPARAAIVGLVRDGAGKPIEGVDVVSLGSSLRALTDAAGRFTLPDLPAGQAVLQLRRIGYRAELVDLTLEQGETLRLGFTLAQERAFKLPGLVADSSPMPVLAPGERTLEPNRVRMNREGAPPSSLITREELRKTKSNLLVSVLMSHGIRIRVDPHGQNILLCPRNAGRPALYIDGQMVDRGESFTHEFSPGANVSPSALDSLTTTKVFDLESYPLDRIDAVEIYASPSQQPTGFNKTGAVCTVLIWTRR